MNDEIIVLNTSVLVVEGTYRYERVTLSEAQSMALGAGGLMSVIGHPATTEVVSRDLGVPVPINRVALTDFPVGQRALVFKLRGRAPVGAELTIEEIQSIGYDYHELTRLE